MYIVSNEITEEFFLGFAMDDVCQDSRRIEVNKKNRVEVRLINDPYSFYNRRGPGRGIQVHF